MVRWPRELPSESRLARHLVVREWGLTHVTVFRWVQRFTPLLIDAARSCRHAPGDRWFVDAT
jgi:transposase, IS6 family